jgi:hypothetical protein
VDTILISTSQWNPNCLESKIREIDVAVHVDSDWESQRHPTLIEASKNLTDEEGLRRAHLSSIIDIISDLHDDFLIPEIAQDNLSIKLRLS